MAQGAVGLKGVVVGGVGDIGGTRGGFAFLWGICRAARNSSLGFCPGAGREGGGEFVLDSDNRQKLIVDNN